MDTSLLKYIESSLVNGELPRDFSLPKETDNDEEIIWADGAMDGVAVYHMGYSDLDDEDKSLMIEALKYVSDGNYEKADELFIILTSRKHALQIIDPLQSYINSHRNDLDAVNLNKYGLYLLTNASRREMVKLGLSFLELFVTDKNEEIKRATRIIGLSDEFTLFAIYVMAKWKDGNNEIWQLAKKVHSWGRIHAIEIIEPVNEEIRKWFLIDGVHNDVMDSYSALICWNKAGCNELIHNIQSKEEYNGIRDIIRGMLNESAVAGLSKIENKEEVILVFLSYARNYADEIEDFETVLEIKEYFEHENEEIVSLCNEIINTDKCRGLVKEAVKKGHNIELAEELKIDYRNDLYELMKSSFKDKHFLCSYLMDDLEYKDKVIDLFHKNLPLNEMKVSPSTTLGLGEKYWKQRALECLLQELNRYPLEGIDFVETGLQSEPIRTRNLALSTIEAWVSQLNKPLSELLPELDVLLNMISLLEPD